MGDTHVFLEISHQYEVCMHCVQRVNNVRIIKLFRAIIYWSETEETNIGDVVYQVIANGIHNIQVIYIPLEIFVQMLHTVFQSQHAISF